MKIIMTAFCSLALTLVIAPSIAWSQLPNQQHYGGYNMPVAQSASNSNGIMQASYNSAVDCDDACDGTCGGSCDGSCRSGIFGSLLGRGAGVGSLFGSSGRGLGGGRGFGGSNGCWLGVEYLLWWNKDRYIPALATTSPPGTPIVGGGGEPVAGALGQPTTSILIGDAMIGGDPYSGIRVSAGKWLDDRQTLGLGGRFFTVGEEDDFGASSNASGEPILGRPFFNIGNDVEDALLVSYPGISHGSINATAENRAEGFDIFFRKLLLSGYCNRFDVIGGYQYSNVEDSVFISNSLIVDAAGDPRIPAGSRISTSDYFEVQNEFNGGFVGLMASAEDGRLSWNMLAKVAAGNMNQQATIAGSTTTHAAGGSPDTQNVGLLALPTNIGSFDQDEFAIVPEINVSVGCNVSKNFRVTLGYTFIYWSEVALSGDMIDTTINTSQLQGGLAGPARPTSSLQSDGFWYTGSTLR